MSQTTTYAYDLHGNVVKKTMPNGEKMSQSFDALNRVVTIVEICAARLFMCFVLNAYACARTPSPLSSSAMAAIAEKLRNFPSDNFYLNLFKHVNEYVIEKSDQKLLKNYELYKCELLDSGINEHDFIFATDRKMSHFWILTEDISVLSALFKSENVLPVRRPEAVIPLAIEACKLSRPFYRYFVPLVSQKDFDDVLDKARTKTKFSGFSMERVSEFDYKVSGLLLIRSDLVRRTIRIDSMRITFEDTVLEKEVGKFKNPHD